MAMCVRAALDTKEKTVKRVQPSLLPVIAVDIDIESLFYVSLFMFCMFYMR